MNDEYKRITYLQKKYNQNYTKGEYYTKEYNREIKKKERVKERVREAHIVADKYDCSKNVHRKIANLIYELKTLKTLHNRLGRRKITVILVIFLLYEENHKLNKRKIGRIRRDEEIKPLDELLVAWNLLKHYRNRQPLRVGDSVEDFYVNDDQILIPVYYNEEDR